MCTKSKSKTIERSELKGCGMIASIIPVGELEKITSIIPVGELEKRHIHWIHICANGLNR